MVAASLGLDRCGAGCCGARRRATHTSAEISGSRAGADHFVFHVRERAARHASRADDNQDGDTRPNGRHCHSPTAPDDRHGVSDEGISH